jgi:hypothetical protein
MDSLQTRMGPDRPIKSPPILWGTSSPTGHLFEAIFLLTGCLHTGIADRLPPPVLIYILNKIWLLRKYPQRVLEKISLKTLALAEREFRASRAGRRRPETQPS